MMARNDGSPSITATIAVALICTGPSGSCSVPPKPPLAGSRTSDPPPGMPLSPPSGDLSDAAIWPTPNGPMTTGSSAPDAAGGAITSTDEPTSRCSGPRSTPP